MTLQRRVRPEKRYQPRLAAQFGLTGVLLIFGGEAFCLLGPLRYERLVHFACHALFYAGIFLVCLAIVWHLGGRRAL